MNGVSLRKTLAMPAGASPFQSTGEQGAAGAVAGGAAAHVAVVEGLPVDELHVVAAPGAMAGMHSTSGSARKSACTIEYGVSLLGVGTAVS